MSVSICNTTTVRIIEWIVSRKKYDKLSLFCRSVGHRLKIHKVTPAVVNECGDIDMKDYVILEHGEDNDLLTVIDLEID